MKKGIILGLAVLGLAATSCKKDYTCVCSVGSGGASTEASTKTINDTKKKAKEKCEEGSGTTVIFGTSITTSCEIKD